MNFDIESFKKNLKEKTKITFLKSLEKLNIDEISGFALYSDNDAIAISATVNTFEYLKEMQELEPGFDEYFRWTPGNWKYEMFNGEDFDLLAKELRKSIEIEMSEAQFVEYRNSVWNASVEVLEELKEEGLFSKMKPDFVLTFAISDFDDSELEIEYVKRLNNEEQTNVFIKWIESETENN